MERVLKVCKGQRGQENRENREEYLTKESSSGGSLGQDVEILGIKIHWVWWKRDICGRERPGEYTPWNFHQVLTPAAPLLTSGACYIHFLC